MKLINIPSLTNNYIWILHNNKQCIIVDPGEHKQTLHILGTLNLDPCAIFLTHHHNDHIDGVPGILKHHQNIPIYGPKEIKNKNSNILTIEEGETIKILNLQFKILSLPGHTLGHIGFYKQPWLFCGDTIFSAGCGKNFEGTKKTMYKSLQKIKKLNKNTLICSAHEYTSENIKFSLSLLPEDKNLISYNNYIQKIKKNKQPSLPSTLKNELKVNLFLRCHETTLKKKLGLPSKKKEWKVFSKLRERKDNYK